MRAVKSIFFALCILIGASTENTMAQEHSLIAFSVNSEITEPESGRIEGEYKSIDIVRYMSALCSKVNGTASFVVPKKYGKFTRLTQVEPAEALDYLTVSGDGKEGWMLACEGERRFIVEKNFRYRPDEDNKFFFHQNRGLEGVDYIKITEAEEKTQKMNSPVSTMLY